MQFSHKSRAALYAALGVVSGLGIAVVYIGYLTLTHVVHESGRSASWRQFWSEQSWPMPEVASQIPEIPLRGSIDWDFREEYVSSRQRRLFIAGTTLLCNDIIEGSTCVGGKKLSKWASENGFTIAGTSCENSAFALLLQREGRSNWGEICNDKSELWVLTKRIDNITIQVAIWDGGKSVYYIFATNRRP